MLEPLRYRTSQLLKLNTRGTATVDVQGYVEPGLRRPVFGAAPVAVFAYDVGFCVARSVELGNAKALYRERVNDSFPRLMFLTNRIYRET